ncbi:hypothetical protein CBL_10526 [Carabus blaptoides fortunei]
MDASIFYGKSKKAAYVRQIPSDSEDSHLESDNEADITAFTQTLQVTDDANDDDYSTDDDVPLDNFFHGKKKNIPKNKPKWNEYLSQTDYDSAESVLNSRPLTTISTNSNDHSWGMPLPRFPNRAWNTFQLQGSRIGNTSNYLSSTWVCWSRENLTLSLPTGHICPKHNKIYLGGNLFLVNFHRALFQMDRKRPLTNDELHKYWENLDDDDPLATSDDSLKDGDFRLRFNVTTSRPCAILNEKISRQSDEFEVFLQVFPRSLMTFIAQCTNTRLQILRKSKKKKIDVPNTDTGEIMIPLGSMLVMTYNRVPNFTDYWSKNPSLGNEAIKTAIARNRAQLLLSKMYFNYPEKGADAPKTYYIDEVVSCLRYIFPKCREDSAFQSIDESMAKFKGRSSLKQYLPLKPIKRGIKIWERCDAETGYVYDLNIYSGRDNSVGKTTTTLGEKVVSSLISTIRDTRKSDSQFLCNNVGTLAVRWQDSKEVLVITNCTNGDVKSVTRNQKDGEKKEVPCPEAIVLYNKIMDGVDLSDQKEITFQLKVTQDKDVQNVPFRSKKREPEPCAQCAKLLIDVVYRLSNLRIAGRNIKVFGSVYTLKLWCFDALQFLRDFVKVRPSIYVSGEDVDNPTDEEDMTVEYLDEDLEYSELSDPSPATRLESYSTSAPTSRNIERRTSATSMLAEKHSSASPRPSSPTDGFQKRSVSSAVPEFRKEHSITPSQKRGRFPTPQEVPEAGNILLPGSQLQPGVEGRRLQR